MERSERSNAPSWQSLLELAAIAVVNAANDEIDEAVSQAENLVMLCIFWRGSMPRARLRKRKTLIALMHTACIFWSQWPKEITKFIIEHGGLVTICEFLEYHPEWRVKGYYDIESGVTDYVVAKKHIIAKIDLELHLSRFPREVAFILDSWQLAYAN